MAQTRERGTSKTVQSVYPRFESTDDTRESLPRRRNFLQSVYLLRESTDDTRDASEDASRLTQKLTERVQRSKDTENGSFSHPKAWGGDVGGIITIQIS
jgi:hypothetical protein